MKNDGEECLNSPCVMVPPSVILDVGTDLLAMCQRNVALNSHLTATGGEGQNWVGEGRGQHCQPVITVSGWLAFAPDEGKLQLCPWNIDGLALGIVKPP